MGGRADLEGFYREYHGKFFRYAWRLIGSEDKASDLVQEAFARALPKLMSADPAVAVPQEMWPNYLYRAIHNLAVNLGTRSREEVSKSDEFPLDARHDRPDVMVEGTAERVDVRRCLDSLKPEERSALVAAHQGFKLREIAEMLEISPAAAFRRVKTAEKNLVSCLGLDGTDA